MIRSFWHMFDPIFPEIEIYSRKIPKVQLFILFIFFTVIFSFIFSQIPMNKYLGFDWVHFWGIERIPPFYPPWTIYVVRYLTYPLLVGITLAAFLIGTIQRSCHPISAIAAFICLPLIWTIILGQLEGLTTLGMLGLPFLIPLVLIKPQISIFGLGARRSYVLAFIVFMLLSLLLWGNWIEDMLAIESFYAEGRYAQNIGLGFWGLPLFLLTLWFSRGDMDMLMASGAFLSPHIIFYNFLPLTPAVSRLKPRAAIVALVLSFMTLSSNWLGPIGW